MPQLIPAPRAFFDSVRQEPLEKGLDGDDDDGGDTGGIGGGGGGKPKVVKTRFWQYEEIDEKPKEKAKRKLVSLFLSNR